MWWEAVRDFLVAHYDTLKDFAGPSVALVIAYFGFRGFRRWKREQLEERRMEVAFQALKLAYQSTYVFEHIRSPLIEAYEWADMPKLAGDETKRSNRGTYYAILKRIEANKDFFKSVWDIQPACMAMFGVKIEQTFLELHKARRAVEVACQMLHNHLDDISMIPDPHKELWEQLRADLSGDPLGITKEGDRVAMRLTAFRDGIEGSCRPVVERRWRRPKPKGVKKASEKK